MTPASRSFPTRPRRGAVLIVAMLVVFGLAGLLLALSRNVRVDAMASANEAAVMQASAIERGAEQYVLAILAQQKDSLADVDESYFAQVPVGDGYFWILLPDYGESGAKLFGLTDEAGKLNINVATYNALMALPNMTDDVAAAIVDWRDADDNPSPGGAEREYYSTLAEPYLCKNGPFETVEEVLMVRGMTRPYLYGNGQAPPLGEQNQIHRSSGFMTDLATARGLYDYLTIYGETTNTPAGGGASNGAQRININDRNQRSRLRDLLRQQLGNTRGDEIFNAIGTRDTYRDIFDFHFQRNLKSDEFAKIAEQITSTTDQPRGQINLNTAPREVLMCLGLESADADKIVAARQGSSSTFTSIASLVDILDKKAIGLEGKVTTKSTRYSADILAVSGNGRAFKRVRIVINASGTTPQIIYRRDITDRGWPLDPQILESIRAGQGLDSASGLRSSGLGGLRQ